MNAEYTTRRVPLVAMEKIHEAEAAFFDKHPDAGELIDEWMQAVNVLAVGTDKWTNVLSANDDAASSTVA